MRVAGAAGGALQTAQRIGAAIGTALLASVFYRVLTGGHAYRPRSPTPCWAPAG